MDQVFNYWTHPFTKCMTTQGLAQFMTVLNEDELELARLPLCSRHNGLLPLSLPCSVAHRLCTSWPCRSTTGLQQKTYGCTAQACKKLSTMSVLQVYQVGNRPFTLPPPHWSPTGAHYVQKHRIIAGWLLTPTVGCTQTHNPCCAQTNKGSECITYKPSICYGCDITVEFMDLKRYGF